MINNNMCEQCEKQTVCKINDILYKFDEDAKKPLGVDITMEACNNFSPENKNDE